MMGHPFIYSRLLIATLHCRAQYGAAGDQVKPITAESKMFQRVLPHSNSPLLSMPTSKLLSAFGAGNASPGSGSAAALMGLVSAELILTVCSISKEKDSCMADYATFDKISKDITNNIVPRLSELFEKDAILFDAVITLRRLRDKSKSDEKKSDFKRLAIELLEPANDCIFEITEICLSLIDYGNLIFEKGWRFVKGDSGAAISAAISGVVSGICIISLNFETLGPREYSRENMQKFARLYSSMQLKHCDALNAANSIHDKAMDALKQPQPQH